MPSGKKTPPGPLSVAIAEILRARKAVRKVTDETLSQRTGISRSQINSILNGNKKADVEQIEALAIALDLTLRGVISDAEKATEGRQLG